MFFLRCAFFLSIVYSSMSWTHGPLQPRDTAGASRQDLGAQAAAAGRSMATLVASRAVSGAKQFCASHVDECLSDTARLTALFAADDSSATPAPAPEVAKPARIERSRHHGRDEKVTRPL